MMKPPIWLAIFAQFLRATAAPAPEPSVVVSYVELEVVTQTGFTISAGNQQVTYDGNIYTRTIPVYPTITSPAGISTTTIVDIYYERTVVQILLPEGSGEKSTSSSRRSTSTSRSYNDYYYTRSRDGPSTRYMMNVTYSPLPSCTSQDWVLTTAIPVYLTSSAQTTMAALTTRPYVYSQYPLDYSSPTPVTGADVFINPTALPAAIFSSISSNGQPYDMAYCYVPTTSCYTSTATATSLPASTTVETICKPTFINPYLANFYKSSRRRRKSVDTRIIIIACVGSLLVAMLIFGLFWTNYKHFAAMMCGQERQRGVLLLFCICIPCMASCGGPRWKARSQEDQEVLTARWKAWSAVQKFKLWLMWGLGWKYPVELLGEEPERVVKGGRKQKTEEQAPTVVEQVDVVPKERV